MTDDERLRRISAVCDEWRADSGVRTSAELIARIRAVLDDVPSVEWRDSPMSSSADNDGWTLVVMDNDKGTWNAIVYSDDGDHCVAFGLPSRDSAKSRAVALYVALRGVT